MEGYWSPSERAGVGHALQYAIVGSADTAAEEMQKLLDKTGADEVMFTAQIFDHEARLKSFQIAANIASNLIS
jgi:alkanesulfonate monooxygenase SsuD/methylene tetrahydromethanopterin reductase-like flavin-dependent oxidoreductase (luciferase family)